jgi:DnaJ-class molecular chaperone
MGKNYFAVLGVTTASSADEIRSAYRRLAKEYHPDHSRGDSEPFRQIHEAYRVLGNTARRSAYERSLAEAAWRRSARYESGLKPEPLIPVRRPGDRGAISPEPSFQTVAASLDDVFDWLWTCFFR